MSNLKLNFLLGFSVPLLCWFSPLSLVLLACLTVVVYAKEIDWALLRPWFPLLLILTLSVLAQMVVPGRDEVPAVFTRPFSDVEHVLDFIDTALPSWAASLLLLIQIWLVPVFGSIIAGRTKRREEFRDGLLLGLGFSLVITGIQIVAWALGIELSAAFPNQNSFWSGIQRLTGTFTDPNSFGVVIALCLPFLISEARRAVRFSGCWRALAICCLAAGWLVAGAFSGSRSFFLAIFLYVLLAAWRSSRRALLGAISILVLLVAAVNLVSLDNERMPEGIQRTLSSLRVDRAAETLHSRGIFLKLNSELIEAHPLVGVGFRRFRDFVVPLAAQSGLNTGLWTDNANSFYLGLLAECGIVGLAAFILLLVFTRFRSDAPVWAKDALLVLLVLLFLGPHLEAVEVTIIAAWLYGCAVQIPDRKRQPKISWSIASLCFAPLIFLQSSLLPYGWSEWEREEGRIFRWTTGTAQILLKCGDGGVNFSLRATNPDIGRRPLQVAISSHGPHQQLELSDAGWIAVNIPCNSGQSAQLIKITPSRVWSPRSRNPRGDPRFFGLQVRVDPLQVAVE